MRKSTLSVLGCLAMLLLAVRPMAAQVTTADIVGRVTDATGAVVPAAKVTLTNIDTNIGRTEETTAGGDYVFNLLPAGRYSVKVEKSGFKAFNVPQLTLAAGDRSRMDAQMAVGQATETVEVTGQAALLQTDSSSLGTSVTGKLVQDLPLNGRNYIQLAQLAPGVSPGPANGLATGTRPDDRRLNSSFSVNGQDPVANNNMIDGMDNNERLIGTIGVRPSIDAIQEFKVQTNLYSAEVTRTSAGVINILTKSGTNAFHGTLFEFLRNDKVDANGNYNLAGAAQAPTKSPFRQNQYGGSVGGPIKKDKTFFFGDYEGLKIRQGLLITAQVPTAKQRVGDFSENTTPLNVVNSFGGIPTGAVPGNRLDQGVYRTLLDPLALKLAALYPLPTSSVVNGINYAVAPTRPQDATTFDGRVDHSFSPSWNIYGRYSFNDVTTVQPTGFPSVGGINPGGLFAFAGSNKTRAQNIQLNLVHIFAPTLLLELKGGFTRAAIQSLTVNDGQNTANTLGFPCNAVSCVNIGDNQTFGLPRVIINSGFQELGDAVFVPLLQFDNTFQENGAVTWTRGAHNIKMGASLIRRQFSLVQSASPRGQFTFGPSGTNGGPAPLDNGLGNFLLGTPVTIARNAALYKPGYRAWEPGVYVQDDWRVNKRLTLNLGVRYDIFTPKVEQHDRLANFDPAQNIILIAGQNSSRTTNIATDHSNFAPRAGFAASLPAGVVLRGGFGLSFFPGDYTSGVALKNPPLAGAFSCGSSNTGSITNTGCPTGTGLFSQGVPQPLAVSSFPTVAGPGGTTLDLTKIVSSSLGAVDTNFKTSLNMQFNVIAEKQFGANVVSVGFVGMRGRRLVEALGDINRALPTGTVNAAGTGATSNPRPFSVSAPKITSIGYYTTHGESQYNALQLGFNRRLSKGLSFTSGLTFAHGEDDVTGLGTGTGGYSNLIGPDLNKALDNIKQYDWATSDFNVKRRFSVGGNYELPGKGLKGVKGYTLGGWQTNGSLTWMTGLPFTVTLASSRSGVTGLGTERPNLVNNNILTSNPSVTAVGRYLDPRAFGCTPSTANIDSSDFIKNATCTPNVAFGTLGNAPRNVGIGPNQAVVNLSFFKTFKFTESVNLQFRTEGFNIANHPIFGNPNVTLGNANFGTITQMAGGYTPRQIQFALKLLF